MLASSTAYSGSCPYFSPKAVIYQSNLKLFLTKMISEESSTK
jgi:hypothetical protein